PPHRPADHPPRPPAEPAGPSLFSGAPAMVCRRPGPGRAPPEGTEIAVVTSTAAVADFVEVNAGAYATYGMPAGAVADVFSRPDRLLASPHVVGVVAYDADGPKAAAMTVLSHTIAGVYWVGTVEPGRRRGLGEAVTG